MDPDEDIKNYKPPRKSVAQRIQETPCMKTSLYNGLAGGLATGLGYFLFSSNPKRSTDVALLSFIAVSSGMWCYCRYQWSKQRWEQRIVEEAIKKKGLSEVTALDKAIKHDSKEV